MGVVGGLIQNTHIIVGFKHSRSVYMRRSAAVALRQVGHRKSCTTTRVCGRFPTSDRLERYRNHGTLTGQLTKTREGRVGWGRGDIGRARDLRALCTPLPPPRGVPRNRPCPTCKNPAGDIRRREGGQGLPGERLSYRKTRTRGRSYLHNIQTNTSTRGRKKYKQEEEEEGGGVCLEQS